uniref:Uncharacterized protein n=1 Tax=Leersia perrieri TaxID=77586 RepID=A0A0D9XQ63_9ORYZ
MVHLRQRLLPLLRAGAAHLHTSASTTSSSLHLSRLLLSTAARSAVAAVPFSVEDYLVATCGLTGARAVKASAKISHFKSASNPVAVLAHLSAAGFSRADLAAVVTAEQGLLCVRAKNIGRRVASLRDVVGLSDPQIRSLLLSGGAKGLRGCDVASRIEFWIPFLGSFEMLTSRRSILFFFFFLPSPYLIPAVKLSVQSTISPTTCSMDKIRVAVSKKPIILQLSKKNLRPKIDFMVTEVGLKPERIVEMPILFTYSLEKRLVPWYSVMKVLQAAGLIKKDISFPSLLKCGEAEFIERYVDCHKDKVPGLADVYNAACSGKCLHC